MGMRKLRVGEMLLVVRGEGGGGSGVSVSGCWASRGRRGSRRFGHNEEEINKSSKRDKSMGQCRKL